MRSELAAAAAPAKAAAGGRGRGPVVCTRARSPIERAACHAIRHRVFVEEQAVFAESDLDGHDRDESAIDLIGTCDGNAAGTVRLFELDPAAGLWQGDRLAVLSAYRTRGVGAPLVRCAVATAATLGGLRMTAHIQPANVAFFARLGWTTTGAPEIYQGLVHQPMAIGLPGRDEAFATLRRLGAGINARDL